MLSSRVDAGDRRCPRRYLLVAASLATAALAVSGCGSDASSKDCGGNSSCEGDGAAGTSIDGAPGSTDATPGSTDAAPVDLCVGAECSDLDDPCNRGLCDPDTGECVVQPINEDMPCAERLCDNFGTCSGFVDTCDEVGTHVRTCRDLTCQGGACEVGMPYDDEQACSRDTDGISCDSTQRSCGACGGFGSVCSENGTRTCTRTTFACASGTCRPSSTSSTESCTRETDGTECGTRPCNFNQGTQALCCNATQMCTVACGECITPMAPIFR